MLNERECLKIELFSEGLRLSEQAITAIVGEDKKLLTTGEYATTKGVILDLGQNIYVNSPIKDKNPNFVKPTTPHSLEYYGGKFFVVSGSNRIVEARFVPVPSYLYRTNSEGKRYGEMIATHTDRARISPVMGCAMACHFCDVPYAFTRRKKANPELKNLRYFKHSPEELIDSVNEAISDPIFPAQHLLISGGTPTAEDFGYENDVYAKVVSAFPGLEVDVMMAPAFSADGKQLLDPVELKKIGVNELSINLELYHSSIANKIMTEKENIGLDRYEAMLKKAVEVFGYGNVRSMLVVGIEPMKITLTAVEELAQMGVCPELSPFRPDPITPMRDWPPPTAEFQKELYQRAREIIEDYPGILLGAKCIPCMHNVLNFPDLASYRFPNYDPKSQITTYEHNFGFAERRED